MSDTTIKSDNTAREKLRALASEDHVTLRLLLARLAEREQYQREMGRANEVMERMQRDDPQARQDYLSELGGLSQRDYLGRLALRRPQPTGAGQG